MSKKKKLEKINKFASGNIMEIKAILEALIFIEQDNYPANCLIEIAMSKTTEAFFAIEKNRRILNIANY